MKTVSETLKRAEIFFDGKNYCDPPKKPYLCRYCSATEYDSKVGILHESTCLIPCLRTALPLARLQQQAVELLDKRVKNTIQHWIIYRDDGGDIHEPLCLRCAIDSLLQQIDEASK